LERISCNVSLVPHSFCIFLPFDLPCSHLAESAM
jgi:hypothetical protein